jgi:hypothetical protein
MLQISCMKAQFVAVNTGFHSGEHVWQIFGYAVQWDIQYNCKPHTWGCRGGVAHPPLGDTFLNRPSFATLLVWLLPTTLSRASAFRTISIFSHTDCCRVTWLNHSFWDITSDRQHALIPFPTLALSDCSFQKCRLSHIAIMLIWSPIWSCRQCQ